MTTAISMTILIIAPILLMTRMMTIIGEINLNFIEQAS